jgi:hypothetical protein
MNHPTPAQCCAFAAWQVISETLVEQVWAFMCPTHGQTGTEVMLARYPGAPVSPAGTPGPQAPRRRAGLPYRPHRAA